jgi:hypothetical protein
LKQWADNILINPGIHTRESSDASGIRVNTASIEPPLTIFRRIESNLAWCSVVSFDLAG